MNDTIDYIDAYFSHALEENERQQFETRCSSDEAFAGEVAFYLSARAAAREALLQQKTEQWKTSAEVNKNIPLKPVKKSVVIRWMPYAAAACVIFVMAFYFLFYQYTPQRLAADYLNKIDLKQTMDAGHDSVQMGISDYKSRNYPQALIIFNDVITRDEKNSDAKKYAGLSYLQLKEYDKALAMFKELSGMRSLAFNSGDMLQATTLLERNQPGDKEQAKTLLEKVVRENEEGSKKAKQILDAW